MSGGRVETSTTASPFLPSRPAPGQNTISRAQLLQQHPSLGLDQTAAGSAKVDVCAQCATIEWDNLPSVTNEGAVPHHKYADLMTSSESCQLCRIIQYAAHWQREMVLLNVGKSEKSYRWGSQWITGPVPDIDPDTRVWLFGVWKTAGASMPPHWLFGFGCMTAAKDVSERLRPRDADGAMEKTTFVPNASVRICTDFGDPAASVVPGRVRSKDPESVATFGLVKRWMKICKDQHDCVPKDSTLPARVLAISSIRGQMSLRLVETDGQVGAYVALSHSWGKARPLTTTTHNIEALKLGISLDDLPRTFRDAVNITNELGFEYLWVDSLCIIQDSPDDWAEQSMRMASIYADANITICATGSISDEAGVFVPRSTVYQPPDNDTGLRDTRSSAIATAAVRLSSGQTSQLTFFPQKINDGGLGTLNFPLDPVTQDPLSSRAWVFQERILSPRKLMYGQDQLYWECKNSLFSEDGARGKPNTPLVKQLLDSETGQAGRDRRRNGWPKMVTAYSEGRLTYPTDRLPALAGLAIEVGQATSAGYHAGVWSSHLWQDLLWHVHLEPEATPVGYTYVEDFKAYQEKYHGPIPRASEQKAHPWLEVLEKWRIVVTPDCPPLDQDIEVRMLRQNPDIGEINKSGLTLRRPRSYVAPTWSFASVDAPVTFSYSEDAGLGVVAEWIDIRTELAGPNKYGHVKNGSLTIKGPLLPLDQAPEGSKTFFFGAKVSVGIPEYRSAAGVEIERVFFDIKPVFPCWALMLGTKAALLVIPESEADDELRSGLENLNGEERWVRVGMSDALYGFEKWWEEALKDQWVNEITIV